MSRIAILTPWYGEECTGGAETQARELATRLAQRDTVTVLTTTSRSFMHAWDVDYHKSGRTREGACDVLRFALRPRNAEAFNAINEKLLSMPRERWCEIVRSAGTLDAFIDDSINSPSLEAHLRRYAAAQYDAVIALPYLYGVVVRGIEAANAPVHLIPCLHDEAYARIPRIEDAIHKARSLLFNSAGEAELALRLYGPGVLEKSHVVGEGIAPPEEPAAALPVVGRYYLYLGRRAPEKGIERLIAAFRDHRNNGSTRELTLVLAGPGEQSYDDAAHGIRDLGFVDEATKVRLLKEAVALLQPSQNESYSRVLMEAWRQEIPVVVDANCLATATAVQECRGGLLAGSEDEWIAALRSLEEMEPTERRRVGSLGAQYAAQHADWDVSIARLRSAIGVQGAPVPERRGKRVDQLLEGIDFGDAISDDARGIAGRLRALGYETSLYAAHLATGVDDAAPLPQSLNADAVIYHHSIGSDVAERFIATSARKAVVYHNVTPPRFFAPYLPKVAEQLDRGREQLARVVASADVCVGDSDFNAAEMRDLGGKDVRTIPVATAFQRFDVTPLPRVLRAKRGTTWLFVGRVVPNKGLEALIDAFEAFMALDEDSSLVIVGKYDQNDPYYTLLRRKLTSARIEPYVRFTGYARYEAIVGYYRSADVFVSMSEHEGFCVPLIEAMFFDVPVVAKATTAVPSTLGEAGLLVEPDADACVVAATVRELCTDQRLRAQVIAAQRRRRRAFLPEQVNPLIDAFLTDLVSS